MERPLSGIVAVALVLIVPMAAAAQGATPAPGQVQDATGDLHDSTTRLPVDGSGYTDITGLVAWFDGDRLAVRWDVAAPVPEAPDPLYTAVDYSLLLDSDGDDYVNRILKITNYSPDGVAPVAWHADLWDLDSFDAAPPPEEVEVDGVSLKASVPIAGLSATTGMQFQGLVMVAENADPIGDPLGGVHWADRAPDADREWRPLGASEPAAADT